MKTTWLAIGAGALISLTGFQSISSEREWGSYGLGNGWTEGSGR
jgi:hypothetical protein